MTTVSFAAALRSYLLADADLKTASGDRIYPDSAPAGTQTPHVIMTQLSAVPDFGLDDADEIAEEWQLDVYALDYTAAEQLKTLLCRRLRAVNLDTWSGWPVSSCRQSNVIQSTEPTANGQERVWTRFMCQFSIIHNIDATET